MCSKYVLQTNILCDSTPRTFIPTVYICTRYLELLDCADSQKAKINERNLDLEFFLERMTMH